MKYFKFTEEENKKALERCGITADDAAKAWQEDPADEDKFIRFMRAIGASKPKNEASGTYILKPDVMGRLMKIREDVKSIIDFDEEFDHIYIKSEYVYGQSVSVVCDTAGFTLKFTDDNERVERIKNNCSQITSTGRDGSSQIRLIFTIADAFIHIPDEKKE